VTIGGLHYKDIPNPGRHVGVLLDASAQHGGRTGREVLAVGAATMGLPPARVDEMLALVGLTEQEAKRRLKNYSLGMRQRLGIAHALLGDPSVLILDEPANGLDPAGIHWMRQMLQYFAGQGGTVLLSSHLLHEVEQIADDLVMIGNGRIVAQGTLRDLLTTQGAYAAAADAAGQRTLSEALTRAGHDVRPHGSGVSTDADPAEVGRVALEAQVALMELRPADGAGLEELFLQLTAGTAREDVL
jgi:ABC-2 type transport system ATP-binding protein